MIRAGTLESLEEAFRRALRDTLAATQAEDVEIQALPAPQAAGAAARRLLALTLASYSFRIVVLFDFPADDKAEAFLRERFCGGADPAGAALADALSEYVNMVCGTANRMLASPHLQTGMSTPFALQASCKEHIGKIAPERVVPLRVRLDRRAEFELALCVCVAPGQTLALELGAAPQEAAVGGELELF